jgi:hypothetical protein
MTLHDYTMIPIHGVAQIHTQLFSRYKPWPPKHHLYPFRTFPTLHSHVAPLYVVVNAGPKLEGRSLNAIAQAYSKAPSEPPFNSPVLDDDREIEILQRLQLVAEIWGIIQGCSEEAKTWEQSYRGLKRKRNPDEDQNESRSESYYTRSQSSAPSKPNSTASAQRPKPGGISGSLGKKRKQAPGLAEAPIEQALTEETLHKLSKKQRFHLAVHSIEEWARFIKC